MNQRRHKLLAITLGLLCCLNLACTVNTISSAIPTSFATIVKTIQPPATTMPELPTLTPSPTQISETDLPSGTLQNLQTPDLTSSSTPAIPKTETSDVLAANADEALQSLHPVFFLNTGSSILENQRFLAVASDETSILVSNGAVLGLANPFIQKEGNSSSQPNSRVYGLNSACLVKGEGRLRIEGGKIITDGLGANGIFALGQGANLSLAQVSIENLRPVSPGVAVALGGFAELTEIQIRTSADSSAALKVGRGGGTITSRGGTFATAGAQSPCYLSMGTIFAEGNNCQSAASPLAIVDGASTLALRNVSAKASSAEYAVLLYRSGEAQTLPGKSNFSMEGGTLGLQNSLGALFYVTNTEAQITLKEVLLEYSSNLLLQASANQDWGFSGANGGKAVLILDHAALNGSIRADRLSSISVSLQNNSTYTGAINEEQSAKLTSFSMDSGSTWVLTGNSYVNRISGVLASGNTVLGIIGNGFTLFYDPLLSPSLGGNTYSLTGGGSLTPAN
ncbi:MAG: hypothetical protein VB108_01720 [Anaerolineaceae bacterium]|nr:hypothetical protein [Anaerolineaceae bacterium]